MLSHSVVSDSAILWTIACQILEWAAISYFRGSSWPRDQILVSCISCIGRQILYHWEAPLWRGNPCCYTDVSIISFITGIHTQIHAFTPVCFLEWDYNLHIVLQFAFCSHNHTHTQYCGHLSTLVPISPMTKWLYVNDWASEEEAQTKTKKYSDAYTEIRSVTWFKWFGWSCLPAAPSTLPAVGLGLFILAACPWPRWARNLPSWESLSRVPKHQATFFLTWGNSNQR